MKKICLPIFVIFAMVTANSQILYTVSGNGAKGNSYVMGTHHFAPVSMLDSIVGFNDALASVNIIYGEIPLSEMTSSKAQQLVMKASMAPADSTLSKVFTTAEYDSISTMLKKTTGGMVSLEQMEPLKPAVVEDAILLFQTMKAFPDRNTNESIDGTVQERGLKMGKKVAGFETVEFQVRLLFGDPISAQAKSLMKMVRNDEKYIDFSHRLVNAYVTQDLDEVYALLTDPELGEIDESSTKELIDDRNEKWVETLVELLPKTSVFVCVGAGHLLGEKGVLNLLKTAGYNVEPVLEEGNTL